MSYGSNTPPFKFVSPDRNSAEHWLLGVSPEGIGTIGMLINFAVASVVALLTPPPQAIRDLVEAIRMPDPAPRRYETDA